MSGIESIIERGRAAKVRRFAARFDSQARAAGSDPMQALVAADIANTIAAPEAEWKQLAADMKERKAPSAETRLQIVNLYRQRANLEPLTALPGQPEPAPDPLVARYIALLDARTTRKGNDPHDAQVAAAIVQRLTDYKSAGQWMNLKFDLHERAMASLDVRRQVANVYRLRAGLEAEAAPVAEPTTCANGDGRLRDGSDRYCRECNVAEVAPMLDPAERAAQKQEMADAQAERARRTGSRR